MYEGCSSCYMYCGDAHCDLTKVHVRYLGDFRGNYVYFIAVDEG